MSALNVKIKQNKSKKMLNITKSWKNLRNAKGYVVKCKNKGSTENGSRILENLKIQKYFVLSKTFNVANEMNRYWKYICIYIYIYIYIYFATLFVLNHVASTWIQFKFVTFVTHFSFVTFKDFKWRNIPWEKFSPGVI